MLNDYMYNRIYHLTVTFFKIWIVTILGKKKPPKKTFEGFLIFVSFELEIKVKFWLSGDYMHVTCYLNHTDFSHKYLLAYSFIPVGYFF